MSHVLFVTQSDGEKLSLRVAQSFTWGSDPGPEFYNERGEEGVGKLRFLDKKIVNIADNKG